MQFFQFQKQRILTFSSCLNLILNQQIGTKIMKLLFQPQNQIKFQKTQNNIMEGQIQISNPHQDIFAFKIKCTNPDLFNVDPLKGIIYPKKSIQIRFKTNDPVNLDMAKQIALNQKFLVQYVAVPSENTVPNFRHLQCQKKKLYINMDSAHGSRLIKDNQRMSMHSAISNKYSYLSMKNDGKDSRNLASSSIEMDLKNMSIEQQQERYQKLKTEINDLNNERSEVMYKLSENTRKGSGGGLMIKLIIFIFFLAVGAMAGKRLADKYHQSEEQLRRRQQQEQGGSWFSLDFLFQEEQ